MEQGLLSAATFLIRFCLDQADDLLTHALLLVTDFFLLLFPLFFLFTDGKRWLASHQEVIPLAASHTQRVVDRMDQTIRAVVRGIGLTAIVQGLLAGLAYVVLRVPFPVVSTAVTVILAPLPFVGTALLWSLIVLCFLVADPLWNTLVMLGWELAGVDDRSVSSTLVDWTGGAESQTLPRMQRPWQAGTLWPHQALRGAGYRQSVDDHDPD